jgi:hypothetical protein
MHAQQDFSDCWLFVSLPAYQSAVVCVQMIRNVFNYLQPRTS